MRHYGKVKKGWGHEEIFVSNDLYCGKLLHFNEKKKFSMHFHKDKHETWYVLDGVFQLEIIKTKDAKRDFKMLKAGDVWTNEPLVPHRLTCMKKGTIIEISTPDSVEDNYRIETGDSQK